jgi:hypothetical protein
VSQQPNLPRCQGCRHAEEVWLRGLKRLRQRAEQPRFDGEGIWDQVLRKRNRMAFALECGLWLRSIARRRVSFSLTLSLFLYLSRFLSLFSLFSLFSLSLLSLSDYAPDLGQRIGPYCEPRKSEFGESSAWNRIKKIQTTQCSDRIRTVQCQMIINCSKKSKNLFGSQKLWRNFFAFSL